MLNRNYADSNRNFFKEYTSNSLHRVVVTGDLWLETRSEIRSSYGKVNLCLDILLINLLKLRAKQMLLCLRYIGALDRSLVLTLRGVRSQCC